MADRASAKRRRTWLIVVGVVALLGVGAFVAFRIVADDDATAIPLRDTLQRYRSEVTTTTPATTSASAVAATSTTSDVASEAPAPSALPTTVAPGIYRYHTTGQESVDVLGGATHNYPAETTITVTPDGCGVLLRWDALRERRDEWRLCATSRGIELQQDGLQYHEFFSQPDSEDVRCSASVLVVPIDATPQQPITQSCMLGSDLWTPVWQILGVESRDIGGTPITVTHVVMAVNDNDEYDEETTIDWFLDAHGLPVEVRSTKHSRSPSPIGAVTYDEQYTFELESLTPLQ